MREKLVKLNNIFNFFIEISKYLLYFGLVFHLVFFGYFSFASCVLLRPFSWDNLGLNVQFFHKLGNLDHWEELRRSCDLDQRNSSTMKKRIYIRFRWVPKKNSSNQSRNLDNLLLILWIEILELWGAFLDQEFHTVLLLEWMLFWCRYSL